jgi:hypothetical protein
VQWSLTGVNQITASTGVSHERPLRSEVVSLLPDVRR